MYKTIIRKIETPLPVCGDAYTVATPMLSDAAKEQSIYNLTFRTPPTNAWNFAIDDNMCLYGLSHFVRDHLQDLVNYPSLENAQAFMEKAHAFGYGMSLDFSMWERVINKFGGRLPILIEALPEGSQFTANTPVVQIKSLDEGFGEIAALIEAVMVGQVSIATTALSMRRQLLLRLESFVREDQPELTDAEVRFKASIMIHDFGMRAHSNKWESEMLGLTHLLVFPGTDTFNAAYHAFAMGEPLGSSIAAIAHRTVQSFDKQIDAFRKAVAIAKEQANGSEMPPIVSLVCDCYDFNRTIETDFKKVCEENPDVIAVARPDSGDYVQNVLKIVTEAKKNGFYKVLPNGRIAMTSRKFIQGDAMDWHKIEKVLVALRDNGFSPVECGIFGVGGWLRNSCTRDTLSAAYKLAATASGPVMKLSENIVKRSIPGETKICAEAPHVRLVTEEGNNERVVYYDGSREYDPFGPGCFSELRAIKARVLSKVSFGDIFSPAVLSLQERLAKEDRF